MSGPSYRVTSWLAAAALGLLAAARPAGAQDDAPVSEIPAEPIEEALITPFDARLRVGGAAGTLGYEDQTGNSRSSVLVGVLMNIRLGDRPELEDLIRDDFDPILGVSTGFIVTELADLGPDPLVPEDPVRVEGSALALVPIRLELGESVLNRRLHVALSAGADLLLIDEQASLHTGRNEGAELFPSLGADLGWAITPRLAAVASGDYVFTPADDLFVGLLSLQIGFG